MHGPSAARLLSLASQVLQPVFAGSGMQIRQLDDRRIWVSLPFDLRNRVDEGDISIGRLSQLGEFTLRSYLERHVDLQFHQLQFLKLEVELEQPVFGEVWARFEWPEAELEEWLQQTRQQRQTEREFVLMLLSHREQRVGQVRAQVAIASQLALNGLKE